MRRYASIAALALAQVTLLSCAIDRGESKEASGNASSDIEKKRDLPLVPQYAPRYRSFGAPDGGTEEPDMGGEDTGSGGTDSGFDSFIEPPETGTGTDSGFDTFIEPPETTPGIDSGDDTFIEPPETTPGIDTGSDTFIPPADSSGSPFDLGGTDTVGFPDTVEDTFVPPPDTGSPPPDTASPPPDTGADTGSPPPDTAAPSDSSTPTETGSSSGDGSIPDDGVVEDASMGDGSFGDASEETSVSDALVLIDSPPAPIDAGESAPFIAGKYQKCDRPSDCESNYCVEGVCCDRACTERCYSCVLPSSPGKCTLSPPGVDLRGECGGGCIGTCGPGGVCVTAGAGTSCAPAECTSRSKGKGAAYCSAQGATCPTATVPFDCGAYICEKALRACRTDCGSTDDCAAGFVCDVPNRRCVSIPESQDDGGCGCEVPGTQSERSRTPEALVALAIGSMILGRMRRRR